MITENTYREIAREAGKLLSDPAKRTTGVLA